MLYCSKILKRIAYISVLFFSTILSVVAQSSKPSGQSNLQTLGSPINTLDNSEFSPTVSADGNTMIFESDRGGRWSLYITYQLKPGVWTEPQELKVVSDFVAPTDFLGGPCLGYDGKTFYFTSNRKGGEGGIDIWYSKKNGNLWEVPKNMGKGVNTKGYDGFPSVSADGKHMYFMREGGGKNSPTGQRCCKIFEAERRGSFYINAKPMPYPINTGCEGYPRIMADNKTLIFSSYRNEGKGGYDLYESKLRAGKWTAPIPLSFINTSKDDELISVPESGDVIYLSNTSSNNKDDIYKVPLPKEFRPDQLVSLEGTIRDQETNKIIPATIKVNNIKTKESVMEIKNNEVTGKYTIFLQEGEKYDVSVSSNGRTFHSEVINLDTVKKYQIARKDIKLTTIKENTSFTLNNIFFHFDSTNVRKDSELELDRTVELLKASPTMTVEISAHTDDKGSDAYNNKLSQGRADSVVKYLVSKGIAKERLTAKGYGKTKPSVANDSEENRAKNRRVEFKVLKM